jgi:uncharacterized protein YbjT (DUF2867 family)
MTGAEIAESFAKATGQPVRFQPVPVEQLASFNAELAAMFAFFNDHGFTADIALLRAEHPGLTTLDAWLLATDWKPSAPRH